MVTVDPNEFFRNAVLALCSSLDINHTLHQFLLYLRQHMPAERMILGRFLPVSGSIAHVSVVETGGPVPDACVTIPLPKEVAEKMTSLSQVDRLVADTREDPVTAAVGPFVKNAGFSEIILPLYTGKEDVGYMVLQTRGYNIYDIRHLNLLTTIREPLTLAMANVLRHKEVVELKDRLVIDNSDLRLELRERSVEVVIGSEGGMHRVIEMVEQVAPMQSTVLLLGETGVGKEVIANAIHRLSGRSSGPFIKVNCGAIPETLIDSELFGYEKGAFSGATKSQRGRFERANRGTLFLDEIGELPLQAQTRLLRVLQHREIERVGGSAPIPVDIRIIAATHRNLQKMVQEGLFREDLWFRLNTFPIGIPPLRHRRQDIPPLVLHLVERKSRELGFRIPPEIAQGALAHLAEYHWPGNVRELENVIERALIQNKGRALTLDSFAIAHRGGNPLETFGDDCACVFPCLVQKGETRAPVMKENGTPLTLDEVAEHHIRQVLEMTGGKVHGPDGAAELLGINASTLRNRMNKLGIPYGRKGAEN